MTVSIFIKCLDVSELDCPRVSPCIVLTWMYPRIIRGNFVKDCPNNIQFNPNNCLNIPLLGRKSTREKSSPRLNFRFESKPISQVLFLGFVFNSRDALLVESWCLNCYKTLYLHAAVCRLTLQCITFLQLPEHPRVNILFIQNGNITMTSWVTDT